MRSLNVKRSIVLDGHKTSISLEDPFWSGLKTIAQARQTTLSELVTEIDGARKQSNLSSAIRLFVLNYFRNLSVLNRFNNEEQRMDVAKALPSSVGERLTTRA
jgi:predicted DNA-binding ribbon-helix-helix protein